MKKGVGITTYVTAEVAKQLEDIAGKQDRSLAAIVRQAIRELLEREREEAAA